LDSFLSLTPADLVVVLLIFLPPLLLGPRAVQRNTRSPEEVALEPVADSALPPAARSWFELQDARFAAAGFRPNGTWLPTNLQSRVLMRVYVSPVDAALGGACTLVHESGDTTSAVNWIEFTTVYADGSKVCTANLRRSRLSHRRMRHESNDAPGVDDPVKLRAVHESHCAPRLVRGPRHVDPARFEEEFKADWRRDAEWRCAIGHYRRLGDGQIGFTRKGALIATLDTLWPSLTVIGWRKLSVALVLGFALPFFTYRHVLATPVFWLAPLPVLSALLAAALTVPLLESRALWWAPLLTWLGSRLAFGGDVTPAPALGWVWGMQATVMLASAAQQRRRAKL
jgi:hypothetical protein